MFEIFNTDNLTSLQYNRDTGGFDRRWIQYADNTFEPVRKDQSVSRKQRFPDPAKDW